jgi:DNA-binding response OmpR family regulator
MFSQSAPPTILVADDTDTVRTLFAQLLASEGYRVITAADGAEALAFAQAHLPDVCLLDVRMPELDGVEVCRQLKAAPETRLTPVILITGLADAHDRLIGIEAGADDFLTKPVNPHELKARVRALARMKQLIDELDSAEAAFITLARTIEPRDP